MMWDAAQRLRDAQTAWAAKRHEPLHAAWRQLPGHQPAWAVNLWYGVLQQRGAK